MTLDFVRLTPLRVYSDEPPAILYLAENSVPIFSNNLPRKPGMPLLVMLFCHGTHACIFTPPMNETLQNLDMDHPHFSFELLQN